MPKLKLFEKLTFGKQVKATRKINRNLTAMMVDRPDHQILLAFKYPGNTQYHKLTTVDFEMLREFVDQYQSSDGNDRVRNDDE